MRLFLLFASLALASLSTHAFGAVTINFSGSAQNSNANLEKSTSHALSANVGLGLGEYASIGLTHRRSYIDNGGQKKGIAEDRRSYVYIPFQERTENITNSIDLTLIPYTGVISPFVFGGVARRDYTNRFDYQGVRTTSTQSLYPVPNYGGGVAIQLGAGFQLKVTQTLSPGKQTTIEDGVEVEKSVRDTYTEIWLGYKL